jgi:hypothetical protein
VLTIALNVSDTRRTRYSIERDTVPGHSPRPPRKCATRLAVALVRAVLLGPGMTIQHLLAAAALSLVACVDTPTTPEPELTARAAMGQGQLEISRVVARDPGANICQLLPADGPCSMACDSAALAEKYIPLNTCISFQCTLTDGQQILAGGCH